MSGRTPDLEISLEIHLPDVQRLRDRICRCVTARIAELTDALGIPAAPVINLAAAGGPADSGPLLSLQIESRACRYHDGLLVRVHEWLHGLLAGSGASLRDVREWLGAAIGGEEASRKLAVEFIASTCAEIIRAHPAVLIGPDQAFAFWEDLEPSARPPDPDWIGAVLSELADLRISVRDRARIGQVLSSGLAAGRARNDIVEDLIAALSPAVIEIRAPRDYLQAITIAAERQVISYFAQARDSLFRELGMRYPDLRFATASDLGTHQLSFRINDVEGLPWVGLPPGRGLVNAPPEQLLPLGIQGYPAVNPNTFERWTSIDAKDCETARSNGLAFWDIAQYLVLFLVAELRASSPCFVNTTTVRAELERLKKSFPALAKAALDRFSVEQITRVLRLLVAEQISILDFRRILESLLDYDYVVIDPTVYAVFDPRLPTAEPPDQEWLDDPKNIAAFVRWRSRHYISGTYGRAPGGLKVWLLERSLEELLTRPGRPEDLEKVAGAVRREVHKWTAPWLPAIITSIPARFALRRLLAPEFPRIRVFAYQEIVGEVQFEPVGRIQLPEVVGAAESI